MNIHYIHRYNLNTLVKISITTDPSKVIKFSMDESYCFVMRWDKLYTFHITSESEPKLQLLEIYVHNNELFKKYYDLSQYIQYDYNEQLNFTSLAISDYNNYITIGFGKTLIVYDINHEILLASIDLPKYGFQNRYNRSSEVLFLDSNFQFSRTCELFITWIKDYIVLANNRQITFLKLRDTSITYIFPEPLLNQVKIVKTNIEDQLLITAKGQFLFDPLVGKIYPTSKQSLEQTDDADFTHTSI